MTRKKRERKERQGERQQADASARVARTLAREVMESVAELEEMGLVEVDGGVVRLTPPGHEFAALRASVRAEGRDPDEDLVIRREGDYYAVYDLGEGGAA